MMIMIDFFSLVVLLSVMMYTIRKVAICLSLMNEPIYTGMRNQVLYRRNQLVFCHLLICLIYLYLFVQSATLSHFYFTEQFEVLHKEALTLQ